MRGGLADPSDDKSARGEFKTLSYQVIPDTALGGIRGSVRGELIEHLLESLILAQDERWRRA